MPTTQLAAHTPRPSEARTVEKRTSVATQAFKFGPSYSTIKFSIYTCLATQHNRSPRLFHSTRVDADCC